MEQTEPIKQIKRYTEYIMLISLVLIYGWATYERNFVWKDEFSLWSDVVKKSPDKARGYNEVGMCYYEQQMPDKAIPFFKKSLSLNADNAIVHNNLGLCFLGKGLINQAIEEFQEAIQLNPFDGMYHVNLGIAYWQNGLSNLAYREIEFGKYLQRTQKKRPFYHSAQTQ
jgi:tetratricopeptide (TPR) repeat protein